MNALTYLLDYMESLPQNIHRGPVDAPIDSTFLITRDKTQLIRFIKNCILYQVYRTKGPSYLAQYKCVEIYTRHFFAGVLPLISNREYMMEFTNVAKQF